MSLQEIPKVVFFKKSLTASADLKPCEFFFFFLKSGKNMSQLNVWPGLHS